jgi:AraC-like DNA-binding protein
MFARPLRSRLATAHAYIKRHFRRVPTLDEIAAAAGVSRFYFHRSFRHQYGKTAKRMILELQVAEVQRLALAGVSFAAAAKRVGFLYQSHMNTRFKQVVGTSPRHWLLAARKAAPVLLAGFVCAAQLVGAAFDLALPAVLCAQS